VYAREAYLEAIVTGDPTLLIGGFTDLNINVGHEQTLRELTRVATALPDDRFTAVFDTDLTAEVVVRACRTGDAAWFYLANPSPWPIVAHLRLETPGPVCEVPDGDRAPLAKDGDDSVLDVPLAGFALRAFRTAPGPVRFISCRADAPPEEWTARLIRHCARVRTALAEPTSRALLAPADRNRLQRLIREMDADIAAGRFARARRRMPAPDFQRLSGFVLRRRSAPRRPRKPQPRLLTRTPPEGIHFDPARNCIRVIGFSEERPATPADLIEADRKNGWRKVTRTISPNGREVVTLDTALWIGDDSGRSTFFRIGSPRHPRQTLVVRGTVWVWPPAPSPERSDGLPSVINRLVMGALDAPNVRPELKIACDSPGQHGVYVGFRGATEDGKSVVIHGGSVHMYHAVLTALVQDDAHRWGSRDYREAQDVPRWTMPGWYAGDIRLENSVISWFEGCPLYGLATGQPETGDDGRTEIGPAKFIRIRGIVFAHGGCAVRNGVQYLEECELRNLGVAVAEGGALWARLVRCRFTGNDRNWTLGSINSRGIVLEDCRIGNGRRPPRLAVNRTDARTAARRGIPVKPECRVRRTLTVKVTDGRGRPLRGVFVQVSCPESPDAVVQAVALTGSDGITPGPGQRGALVVTERAFIPSDDPDNPREIVHRFEICAYRNGRPEGRLEWTPGRSPRSVVLRLSDVR